MNKTFIIIGACVIGVLIVIAGIYDIIYPPKRPVNNAPAQVYATPQPVSSISWQEIDSIYNIESDSTNMQKEESWKTYKGRRVMWTGTVSEVSEGMLGGLTLQVKMNPKTLTSDLLIRLKDSEKRNAARLSKGMTVKFSGVLNSWGTILPISLDEGEIY